MTQDCHIRSNMVAVTGNVIVEISRRNFQDSNIEYHLHTYILYNQRKKYNGLGQWQTVRNGYKSRHCSFGAYFLSPL